MAKWWPCTSRLLLVCSTNWHPNAGPHQGLAVGPGEEIGSVRRTSLRGAPPKEISVARGPRWFFSTLTLIFLAATGLDWGLRTVIFGSGRIDRWELKTTHKVNLYWTGSFVWLRFVLYLPWHLIGICWNLLGILKPSCLEFLNLDSVLGLAICFD